MISRYFGIDIPMPERRVASNGEDVNIIPHEVLEDFILNSDKAREFGVSVHYTTVPTNEPRHYVFICAISDKYGRRAENIGEALDDTLESPISKNYPALMAFKRAFDAAAINYLGLDGKIYSDQQINSGTASKVDSSPKATPPIAPPANMTPPSAPPIAPTANSTPSQPVMNAPKPPSPPVGSSVGTTAPIAPPSVPPTAPAVAPPAAPPQIPTTPPIPTPPAPTAPPVSNPSMPPMTNSTGKDIYDTTMIAMGNLKNNPLSVREAYITAPDTIKWILNQMSCFTPREHELKATVQSYVNMMEGK